MKRLIFIFALFLIIIPVLSASGEQFYADGTNTLDDILSNEFDDWHSINYDFSTSNKYVITPNALEDDLIYLWVKTDNDAISNLITDFNFTGGTGYVVSISLIQGDVEPEDLDFIYLTGLGGYSGTQNICSIRPTDLDLNTKCDDTIDLSSISGWDSTLKTYAVLILVSTPPTTTNLQMSFKINGQSVDEVTILSKTGFSVIGDTYNPTFSTLDSMWALPISSGVQAKNDLLYSISRSGTDKFFEFTNETLISGVGTSHSCSVTPPYTIATLYDELNNTIDKCYMWYGNGINGECKFSNIISAKIGYGVRLYGVCGGAQTLTGFDIYGDVELKTYTRNIPSDDGVYVLNVTELNSNDFNLNGDIVNAIVYKDSGSLQTGMCVLSKVSATNYEAYFQDNGQTWYFKGMNKNGNGYYSTNYNVIFRSDTCAFQYLIGQDISTNFFIGEGIIVDHDCSSSSYAIGDTDTVIDAVSNGNKNDYYGSFVTWSDTCTVYGNAMYFTDSERIDGAHTNLGCPSTFFDSLSGVSAIEYSPLYGTSIEEMKTYAITDEFIESLDFYQEYGGDITYKSIMKEGTIVYAYGYTTTPALTVTITLDGNVLGTVDSNAFGYWEYEVQGVATLGTYQVTASTVYNSITRSYSVVTGASIEVLEDTATLYTLETSIKYSNNTQCENNFNCLTNLGNVLQLEIEGLSSDHEYLIIVENGLYNWKGDSTSSAINIINEDLTMLKEIYYSVLPSNDLETALITLPVKDINYGKWNVQIRQKNIFDDNEGYNFDVVEQFTFYNEIDLSRYTVNITHNSIPISQGDFITVDSGGDLFEIEIESDLNNPTFLIERNYPTKDFWSDVEIREAGINHFTINGDSSGDTITPITVYYNDNEYGYGDVSINVQVYEDSNYIGDYQIETPILNGFNSKLNTFFVQSENNIGITNIILMDRDEIPRNLDIDVLTDFYTDFSFSAITNVIDRHEFDIVLNGTALVEFRILKIGNLTNTYDEPIEVSYKTMWSNLDPDNNDTSIRLNVNDLECGMIERFRSDMDNLDKKKKEVMTSGIPANFCFSSIYSDKCFVIANTPIGCNNLCVTIDGNGNIISKDNTLLNFDSEEQMMITLNRHIGNENHNCVMLLTGNYTMNLKTGSGLTNNITWSINGYRTRSSANSLFIKSLNLVGISELVEGLDTITNQDSFYDGLNDLSGILSDLFKFAVVIGFIFILWYIVTNRSKSKPTKSSNKDWVLGGESYKNDGGFKGW